MDKAIIFTIIGVVVLGLLFFGAQNGFLTKIFSGSPIAEVVMPEGIILFYGEGCPHCKVVDDFITENKIEDKVKFSRLEVWYNRNNQLILEKAAETCGIKGDTVGVPFLYDGAGKCIIGDVDAINFFKNEAGTD